MKVEMAVSIKPRLLLVDDAHISRTGFTRFLIRSGFQVDTASTAPLAVRMAKNHSYSVILIDFDMAGIDGSGLIEKLVRATPDAAVIAATNQAPSISQALASATDRLSVITNPWDWDDVLEMVGCASDQTTASHQSHSASALVVEDNADELELLKAHLAAIFDGRCEVAFATTLAGALAQVADSQPDVIVTNLKLPDSVGPTTVECIHRGSPSSAIIAVSENDDEDIATQAVRSGAQDVLLKCEIDQRSLKRAIRYALERKTTEQRLTRLAHFDQLTGVANRITFNDRLAQMLARAKRKGSELGVIFIDLDHFKEVNDSYGHRAGDELLTRAAERICDTLRDYDTVARLGGDEFAVLVDESGEATIRIISDRIVKTLARPFHLTDACVEIGSSLGVAVFPEAGSDARTLLDAADQAMYRAKAEGRNRFSVAGALDRRESRWQPRILKRAIAAEQFVVHYQPQIGLQGHNVTGFEALLRWQPRPGELVAPLDFIPALEDCGLIVEAGRWVIEEACRQLAVWNATGRELRVAINVSPRQIERPGLTRALADALAKHRLAPNAVEMEISESIFLREPRAAQRTADELHELGARVALDDLGVGHASLSVLTNIDVDAIKIDRSFVNTLGNPGGGMANAIITVGTHLGLDIVAEGVENGYQLSTLTERGCTHAQGFLLGSPRPAWTTDQLRKIEAASREPSAHLRAAG